LIAIREAEAANLSAVLALLADEGVHAARDVGDPEGYLPVLEAIPIAGTTRLLRGL